MLNLSSDRLGQLHLSYPDFSDHPFLFSIPEFQGESDKKNFAIRQILQWKIPGENSDSEFSLDGDPSLIGLQVYGQMKSGNPGEAHFLYQVANAQAQDIDRGHSSILLDTSKNSDFVDPDGSRTFFFTDMHWISGKELNKRIHKENAPLRVGLNYSGATLMWKMIARKSIQGDRIIALGANRAYVFASDHPKWNSGLLCGVRWGAFSPGEFHETRMAVYMLNSGNLEDLHPYYMRDMKS